MASKDNRSLLRRTFDVKKMHKEFRQDSGSYNVDLIPFEIEIGRKDIKIYNKSKDSKKLVNNFALNHILAYHETDSSTPGIDSCKVFSDAFGVESVFAFHSPQFSAEFVNNVIKARTDYTTQCCNIVFKAFVENATDESKPTASMTISGMSTGKEIKLWIEKEFNLPEIHNEHYVLGIILNDKFNILADQISAFLLYDHLESNGTPDFCNTECFKDANTIIIEEIYLQIRLNNGISDMPRNSIMYNIEKYCPNHFLPRWLLRLLSDLYYNGPAYQGVFRHSGKESILPKWYQYMLKYNDFVITEDIYNKASVLKYFLRKIEGSLMSENTQKQLHHICKKFIPKKMTAEKYVLKAKNRLKIFQIIKNLPRNNYYILQHILVVFEAILSYENTLLTPLSLAKAISPSIFPLMDLSLWEFTPKLLEAIILLSKHLVQDFARHRILLCFEEFRENDSVSYQSEDISMSSIDQNNSKQMKLSSEEIICHYPSFSDDISHVNQDPLNVEIDLSASIKKKSSFNSKSLSDSPEISVSSQFPIKEDTVQTLCSSPNNFNEIPQNNSEFESQENSTAYCNDSHSNKSDEKETDENQLETSDYFQSNSNLSKNICMGLTMKKILTDRKNPIDFDLSSDLDVKENISSSAQRDKIFSNQRHKSLIKPEIFIKDINRSASTVILSSGCHSLRNSDSIDSAANTNEVIRRNSRKASSELRITNCTLPNHRSRSPVNNVKSLIEVYENKCKSISSENQSISNENSRKNSFCVNDLSNAK